MSTATVDDLFMLKYFDDWEVVAYGIIMMQDFDDWYKLLVDATHFYDQLACSFHFLYLRVVKLKLLTSTCDSIFF